MAGKKNYDLKAQTLKDEFSSGKARKSETKGWIKYVSLFALVAVVAIAVIIAVDAFGKKEVGEVDWVGYGKDYIAIKDTYDDWDNVIANVGGNEILKLDFYKLRISQDYLFESFMELYYEYIELHSSILTDEEKENMKPVRMTDEELIDDLVKTEIRYMAALEAGVKMDYDTALTDMTLMYNSYLDILENTDPEADIVQAAQEFVEQTNMIARGMGVDVEVYIRYLSQDSMKSMAITKLESIWQTDFVGDDFDGTVDEYIEYRYSLLNDLYEVEIYGLE